VYSRGLKDAVSPQQSYPIEGFAILVLDGRPENVTIEFLLNADGMPTQTGSIRFQIDWEGKASSIAMDEASPKEGVISIMPNLLPDDAGED